MSASIFWLKYKIIPEFGTLEANWLESHLPSNDQGKITIDKGVIAYALKDAKRCESKRCSGCAGFSGDMFNGSVDDHKDITKKMALSLPRILKLAKDDVVDLEISW